MNTPPGPHDGILHRSALRLPLSLLVADGPGDICSAIMHNSSTRPPEQNRWFVDARGGGAPRPQSFREVLPPAGEGEKGPLAVVWPRSGGGSASRAVAHASSIRPSCIEPAPTDRAGGNHRFFGVVMVFLGMGSRWRCSPRAKHAAVWQDGYFHRGVRVRRVARPVLLGKEKSYSCGQTGALLRLGAKLIGHRRFGAMGGRAGIIYWPNRG